MVVMKVMALVVTCICDVNAALPECSCCVTEIEVKGFRKTRSKREKTTYLNAALDIYVYLKESLLFFSLTMSRWPSFFIYTFSSLTFPSLPQLS